MQSQADPTSLSGITIMIEELVLDLIRACVVSVRGFKKLNCRSQTGNS